MNKKKVVEEGGVGQDGRSKSSRRNRKGRIGIQKEVVTVQGGNGGWKELVKKKSKWKGGKKDIMKCG